MRMTAPAISAAAVILAAAFVWYFGPQREPGAAVEEVAVPEQSEPAASPPIARAIDSETRVADERPFAEDLATTAAPPPTADRSPLPGETAPTPMANLLGDRQRDLPPGLIEGEREFAAEPVDSTWAPGAEADLLGKFAQMPGLTLIGLQVECRSTMCRLELVQPSGAASVEGGPRPFNILLDSIGLEPRWMMAIGDRSNQMRSVAYLWREGFAPPRQTGQHATD